MICRHCGHDLPDDAITCDRCGEVLPDEKPKNIIREEIPSHLAGAIIVTLLCCWPLGIPAIVYAARVNERLIYGDYDGARQASQNAQSWITYSIIGGAIAAFFIIIFSGFS